MTSSRGNVHSHAAKREKIMSEFFTKTLQIILESRCSYMSSSSSSCSSSFRTRDKWFNLALKEYPEALGAIDFCHQGNFEPMVVDIILWDSMNFSSKGDSMKSQSSNGQFCNFVNLEKEEFGMELRNEKVIERWVVQYESQKSGDSGLESSGNLQTLYKKLIVLLRSLYVTVRLLPAYKLFRDLISSGKLHTYRLKHHVSSFAEPFTWKEEADLQRFSFTPVDTSWGQLCLSVSYRSSLCDVISEPSTPMSPWFIPDYAGSPLADPLKRFPSLPMPNGSPTFSPFSRCHSLSYENYQDSSPSILPFPSPMYSVSYASTPLTFQATSKCIDFDEYWPSLVFSPAPFPSSPMYVVRTDASKALLHAPVSIPASKVSNKQTLRASPLPKLKRAASLKSKKFIGASASFLDKFSIGRDESGRFFRISSNSLPQIPFCRSSRRLPIQYDFDDTMFSCPFVGDDDNMMDPISRPEFYNQGEQSNDQLKPGGSLPVRKSEDAAVGALILMLKKAPPLLHHDASSNNGELILKPKDQQSEKGTSSDVMSPRHGLSMTIADALEELRAFVGIKEMLLSRGSRLNMFNVSAIDQGAYRVNIK